MHVIRNKIIERIGLENIKMKPKWHFILQGILLFVSIMILILILIYLFSFFILFLNSQSFNKLPLHELKDFINITRNLPWIIIIFSFIGLFALETLVNKYEFAHRKPFLYSLIFIMIIITISGYALSSKKYHYSIQNIAPFRVIYERYDMRRDFDNNIKIIEITP